MGKLTENDGRGERNKRIRLINSLDIDTIMVGLAAGVMAVVVVNLAVILVMVL